MLCIFSLFLCVDFRRVACSIHCFEAFVYVFLIKLFVHNDGCTSFACLIIIFSSLASSEIDVCSDNVTFRLIFYFSVGTKGIEAVCFTKASNSSSLP